MEYAIDPLRLARWMPQHYLRSWSQSRTPEKTLQAVNYKGNICNIASWVSVASHRFARIRDLLEKGRLLLDRREARIAALKNLLKERIVILDGAMGTMIQAQQLDEATFRGSQFAKHPKDLRQNYDVLNITQPRIVQAIQRQYLEAGADIIKTNTFNSNAISTLDYGLEHHVHELNVAGAPIAPPVVEQFDAAHPHSQHFLAGSMGPTKRPAAILQGLNRPAFRGVTFH